MSGPFNLSRLLVDVFAPDHNDRALIMVDIPNEPEADNDDWRERRIMAQEWQAGLTALGIPTAPLLVFPATGANNGDLPETGEQDGHTVHIEQALADATIAIAMTRYSATAHLSMATRRYDHLRAASMPNVLRRMEQSALAADYKEVARKATRLAWLLNQADTAETTFSTGHRLRFDLRYRAAHADDGLCRRDKAGFRVINLPSGEAFKVPYEGEQPGEPSRTAGQIPLPWNGALYMLEVEANHVVGLSGDGPERGWLEAHFNRDPARRNIAEIGLGCNDRAIITGNVLEDEKAGFHLAYGRSEHLGGVVGPETFTDPSHVIHHDIVYAKGCPVEIAKLDLITPDGTAQTVILDGHYTEIV